MQSASTGGEELARRSAYRTMRSVEHVVWSLYAFFDRGEWDFPEALETARSFGYDLSELFGGDSFLFKAGDTVRVPKVGGRFESEEAFKKFVTECDGAYTIVENRAKEVVDAYVERACAEEPRDAAPEPPCGQERVKNPLTVKNLKKISEFLRYVDINIQSRMEHDLWKKYFSREVCDDMMECRVIMVEWKRWKDQENRKRRERRK